MEVTDQLGIKSASPGPAERIISLVPSLTELLYELGLTRQIIGVTRYCPPPKDERRVPAVIGGTKDFDFNRIDELSPDLIIGSREENYQAGISRLREKYPVWLCDVLILDDALNMIKDIGSIVGRSVNAARLVSEITDEFSKLPAFPPLKVAYLIWQDPFMVAAGGTFINNMLELGGFVNIFQERSMYPVIILADLAQAEAVLLSSEPYRFTENEVMVLKTAYPHCKDMLVDGKKFSWYGSHLRYTPAYLQQLRAALQQMP